ncbi:ribonuclease Y [Candidatus Falkowbacteria bacterium]|nr:ribonuclease Y [Candidatus Falkowbacteria bacterium]
MSIITFGLIVIGAAVGLGLGFILEKLIQGNKTTNAASRAEKLLAETKAKAQEALLEAKDKALKIIDEAKAEEKTRREELKQTQVRLEDRESKFDQKLLDLENKQQQVYDKAQQLEEIKKKIQDIKEQQLAKLETIAGLTREQAKDVILRNIDEQSKEAILSRLKKLEQEETDKVEERARDIITLAVQRCAHSQAMEITTTTIDLPSDEMKGRIIGREGRNIRVIEQLTGTEIIVDDTPQAITVSGFSPIRRHVAKKALEILIADGRIHPGRIEEAVDEARKNIALDIKKSGEEALYRLGITGFDPKLVQIIGRLKYRTSYGQNVLEHSIEVALLCTLLAEQLGANVDVAKKGGFLHDIGKAVDHEVQGTHPEIGRDIAVKFGLPEEIIAPILTHHDDKPATLEAIIVKVADAISGARPGARKDSYEHYVKRLGELEKVATSFPGIEKAYAIQAGREVRVFVYPEQVDDLQAHNLAREIAKKIEAELKYPGEIKVNVIREMRVLEYAR